ncbi:MAG: rfaE bifunctional protein nucleotidyltransferase chain/domain [Salibacteraceae bacterium]|jgi:rfaE bifunctional protein nucleotidyltransferase chain/domain
MMKLTQSKIHVLDQLKTQVDSWKQQDEKVVFTNGVFDLLHRGHIAYLEQAASLGTKFIIGVNADLSVKTLSKGPARPIKDEYSRAVILAAMQFVDGVVIFGDSTPQNLIDSLQPHVLVKGGDYDPMEQDITSKKYIVGRETVFNNGGTVQVIPFLEGFSTTAIEQKIIALNK